MIVSSLVGVGVGVVAWADVGRAAVAGVVYSSAYSTPALGFEARWITPGFPAGFDMAIPRFPPLSRFMLSKSPGLHCNNFVDGVGDGSGVRGRICVPCCNLGGRDFTFPSSNPLDAAVIAGPRYA